MSSYQITTEPATEPLTLTEAKEHLRVDGTDEDTLITSIITVARKLCENYTNRAFITQTWTQTEDFISDEFQHLLRRRGWVVRAPARAGRSFECAHRLVHLPTDSSFLA